MSASSDKTYKPKMKNEHEGHRQRLKNRALLEGLTHFEDHVLLELLLFYTIPRSDTNETAHRLLNRFGTIAGVLDASVASLEQVDGIGRESALFLHLLPQICQRYLNCQNEKGVDISSPFMVAEYLSSKYLGKNNEVVYLICADSHKRTQKCIFLSEGNENHANVNITGIIQEVTAVNATNVILAHNHPCGPAIPSEADIQLTKSLSAALRPLRVSLLDHMIFAPNSYISMNSIPNLAQYFDNT